MIIIRGIKAWITGLVVLAAIILILVLIFQLFLLLLPLIMIIIAVSYFFRMLNKLNKKKASNKPKPFKTEESYIDVKYKVKK